MYKFNKFTSIHSKTSNYTISINRSYSFGFNSAFYKRENIKKYKKVVLFYDPNKRAVGFQFVNDENTQGAFTLIHGNFGTTGSVTARSFFIENDLHKEEYFGKKIPKKIEDPKFGSLYVIDLLEKRD